MNSSLAACWSLERGGSPLRLEASLKGLFDTPEDVPTDKRAREFEKCFVNVSTSLEASA